MGDLYFFTVDNLKFFVIVFIISLNGILNQFQPKYLHGDRKENKKFFKKIFKITKQRKLLKLTTGCYDHINRLRGENGLIINEPLPWRQVSNDALNSKLCQMFGKF